MNKSIKGLFALLLVGLTALLLVACGDDTPKPTPTEQVEVTFVMNEGTPAVAKQTFNKGGKATKPSPDPTRTGHTFGGWYKEASFATPFNFTDAINENTQVYAMWTKNPVPGVEYTVTFNPGDGEVDPETVKVAKDGLITQPSTSYIGYDLVGWFKDAEYTQSWNFATDKVTENITLYAKWEVLPEGTAITTVSEFYQLVQGISSTPEKPSIYEAGGLYYLTKDLDFKGFTWNIEEWKSSDGNSSNKTPELTFTLLGRNRTIKNLEIKGTADALGIFNTTKDLTIKDLNLDNINIENEGSGRAGILIGRVRRNSTVIIDNVSVTNSVVKGSQGVGGLVGEIQGADYGDDVTNKPTQVNVTILKSKVTDTIIITKNHTAGGFVGENQAGLLTIEDAVVDVELMALGDGDTDGRVGGIIGSISKHSTRLDLPDLKLNRSTIRVDITGNTRLGGIIGMSDNNMEKLEVEKVYRQGEKNITGVTTATFGDINNTIVIANINGTRTNGTVEIGHITRKSGFIDKIENTYVVAFNSNMETKGHDLENQYIIDQVSDIPTTVLNGFYGWTVSDELPVLHGIGINLGHKVSLIIGENTKYQYVRDGKTLSNIYVSHPDFESWMLGEEIYVDQVITADTTLIAKLVAKNRITFDVDGGLAINPIDVVEGQLPPTLADANKPGYAFKGWFTDTELTLAYEPTLLTEDITLYAKFVDETKPEITVTPERGTVTLLPEKNFILTITMDDVEPYLIEIDHWFGDHGSKQSLVNGGAGLPEFKVYANADNPYGDADDKTAFEEAGVTVTYNSATKTWTIDFGSQITAIFVEHGIEFYLVAEDMSGNAFGSMYEVTAENTFTYELLVESNTHTVSFNSNEGSVVDDIVVADGETLTLPVDPTKTGFTFVGWFTDTDLTIAYEPGAVSNSFTLHAKWNIMTTKTYILNEKINTEDFFEYTQGLTEPEHTTVYDDLEKGIKLNSAAELKFDTNNAASVTIVFTVKKAADLDKGMIVINGIVYDINDYIIEGETLIGMLTIEFDEATPVIITRNNESGKKEMVVYQVIVVEQI